MARPIKTRKSFENLYVEINRLHRDFRLSLFDEGRKVRDDSLPVNLLKLAEVVYQVKKTNEYVSLPLKAANDSDYRLYCLDTGFLAYQSGISLIDFQNPRNTNMGVFFENYIAYELACHGVILFYWRGKITQSLNF